MNLFPRSRVMIGIMACILVIVSLIFFLFFAESPNACPGWPRNFFIRSFFPIVSQPAKKNYQMEKCLLVEIIILCLFPQYSCLQSHLWILFFFIDWYSLYKLPPISLALKTSSFITCNVRSHTLAHAAFHLRNVANRSFITEIHNPPSWRGNTCLRIVIRFCRCSI